jgi:hypothetical protein
MARGVMVNEFDMKGYNDKMKAREVPNRDGSEDIYTPLDVNVGIQLFRKIEDKSPKRSHVVIDQLGHTLVVDYFVLGVKAYFKYERRSGKLTVFLEDADGTEVIATYE